LRATAATSIFFVTRLSDDKKLDRRPFLYRHQDVLKMITTRSSLLTPEKLGCFISLVWALFATAVVPLAHAQSSAAAPASATSATHQFWMLTAPEPATAPAIPKPAPVVETLPTKDGIFDWSTVKAPTLLAHFKDEQIDSMAVSPDGKQLAFGLGFKTPSVVLWDIQQGREQYRLTQFKANSGIHSLAYTPDGCCLITGSSGALVQIWHLGSKKLLNSWQAVGSFSNATNIKLSGDGKLLAVYTGTVLPIKLLKVPSLQTAAELKATSSAVTPKVYFTPDNKRILIVDRVNILSYDIASQTTSLLFVFNLRTGLGDVDIRVEGDYIYVSGNIAMQKWNYVTKHRVWLTALPDVQTNIGALVPKTKFGDFSISNGLITSAVVDELGGEILFINTSTGNILNRVSNKSRQINPIVFGLNGRVHFGSSSDRSGGSLWVLR
jgi:hypothetical protein